MRNGKINENKHKKFIKILKERVKKIDHTKYINDKMSNIN